MSEEQVFERGQSICVFFINVPEMDPGDMNIGECGWYNSKKSASLSTARIQRKNPLAIRNVQGSRYGRGYHYKGDWK